MINKNLIKFNNKQIDKIVSDFKNKGYARLGQIISKKYTKELLDRTYDLMMGRVKYKNMFFKLDDSSGDYFKIKHQDVKNEFFSGPSTRYRKIKDLEYEKKFFKLIKCNLFKQLTKKIIGNEVSSMRAMVLNKPYINSSILPFHQDVSEKWPMTGKPSFTIWLSLNGANKKKGCLKVVEKSHQHGIIGEGNNLLDKKLIKKFLIKNKIKYLNCKPSEAFMFSNYTLHGSDKNKARDNRVAFTICYMDSKIKHKITKKSYPKIFGKKSLTLKYVSKLKAIPAKVYELNN